MTDPAAMASLKQKIAAEVKMRELIEEKGLPEPDMIEYGYTCIRLFWNEPKIVLIVDIDEIPPELGHERIGIDLPDDSQWPAAEEEP